MTLPAPTNVRPPFYAVDLPHLQSRLAEFRAGFSLHFRKLVVGHSYKTNNLPAIARCLHESGAYAEVVSPLEYRLARAIGVPGTSTIVNGPGKSPDLVRQALAEDALLNLDSLDEVDCAVAWARSGSVQSRGVGLRVNLPLPENEPARSRFGLGVDDGGLAEASARLRAGGLSVAGLHAHVTSRQRKLDYYRMLARELVRAGNAVGRSNLAYLDVGGGFGFAPAGMGLLFPPFPEYAEAIASILRAGFERMDELTVVTEPGIAMVGDCVSYFAPVLAVKRSGARLLAIVDASVQTVKPTKHPRHLPTSVLDPLYAPKTGPSTEYDVVGYTCLEDDLIAVGQELPFLQPGDVLRFDNVGAYTFVFKPQFIRARPAFYTWNGERYACVRREETFEEFFSGCTL